MQNTTSTTACESRAASSVATFFVCYEENYAEQFDEAGKEQYASVWVYLDKSEFAKESYGISVDSFDLSKSKNLLSSMFA